MAFDTYEESVESGGRIELYSLAIGNEIYRMHDSIPYSITYDSDLYYKVSVSRGKITGGQEHTTINLPGDHQFVQKFATVAPGQTATLTIYAYQFEDPSDVRVIYKGVVRSVAFTSNMAFSALSVVPIAEAFSKEIPERTFQASCNNVLFDGNCKVSSGLFSYEGQVTAVVGNVITVNGLETAKGDGWSTGGFVSYGTLDYRLVLEQDGDDLTLVLPFYEDVLSQNVTAYAGCDHTIGICASKFSNSDNFGGCPHVPTKNIFTTGI